MHEGARVRKDGTAAPSPRQDARSTLHSTRSPTRARPLSDGKEIIAPPRSSLRMRTLRGGARYYVEKLNRRAKDPGSQDLTQLSEIALIFCASRSLLLGAHHFRKPARPEPVSLCPSSGRGPSPCRLHRPTLMPARRCGICSAVGHNRQTCPQNRREQT